MSTSRSKTTPTPPRECSVADYIATIENRAFFIERAHRRALDLVGPSQGLKLVGIDSQGILWRVTHHDHQGPWDIASILMTPHDLVISDREWSKRAPILRAQHRERQALSLQAHEIEEKARRRALYKKLRDEFEGRDDLL